MSSYKRFSVRYIGFKPLIAQRRYNGIQGLVAVRYTVMYAGAAITSDALPTRYGRPDGWQCLGQLLRVCYQALRVSIALSSSTSHLGGCPLELSTRVVHSGRAMLRRPLGLSQATLARPSHCGHTLWAYSVGIPPRRMVEDAIFLLIFFEKSCTVRAQQDKKPLEILKLDSSPTSNTGVKYPPLPKCLVNLNNPKYTKYLPYSIYCG